MCNGNYLVGALVKHVQKALIARHGTVTGADVNRSTTTNDHTVLSLACAGGHHQVVELLLASGADANHKLKVPGFVLSLNTQGTALCVDFTWFFLASCHDADEDD